MSRLLPLKTRAANSEGVGEIGLGELIVQALRMGPDRLVVGECRGAEGGAPADRHEYWSPAVLERPLQRQ